MEFRKNWKAACLALLGAVFGTSAFAEDGECFGFGDLEPGADLSLGTVSNAAPRVNFIKGSDAQKECPGNAVICRDKGYLVPGDIVIAGGTDGDFVCVDYINAKGLDRAGWLPRSAVILAPAQAAARREDWVGRWNGGPEQSITVRKGRRAGEIEIDGNASFGASDPDRVKRGAVNMGSIEASLVPDRASLAFTMGDNQTLHYDKGDDTDCKVRMRLLGPFLLVKDNGNCGGFNVSFSGAYQRKK